MKPVECIKKKQCADTLVQIGCGSSKCVKVAALVKQIDQRHIMANRVQRLVARDGIARSDYMAQAGAHGVRCSWRAPCEASSSISCVRTSSRSDPEKASASCASNRPYLTPML